MELILLIVHLVLAVALIGVVLLQRSEGGALGIGGGGGGGMSGFLTGAATANLLTRATAVIAALFIATSMGLAIMSSNKRAPTSVVTGAGNGAPATQQGSANAPADKAPAAPTAPKQ
ncbi:MAG: preprotein translocase subunit SecG [Rhodospirillaceae bacterium]|nr:preprotein translocase subunit SecG [Rhodospirillaceae bacterium]MCY4065144.1 preprotein translocase subunit SecG [Rhodospirillaceae bacterium]MDE0704775.1 preprotein translocase subunit SecG [Rhodospirillaceae bacterium]MXW90733.1 preprotein translocase subunit SecG [Rhodospirillaceae bacterium]MYB12745.1 preprotein translocase subunit SecG [Rhodospirillaceae bacterium]